MSAAANDWDAGTYDRVADPQFRWGLAVLDRLELRGDERVLDAGCGSGRVTEALLERLPRGEVVALDVSPAMLEEARRRLAPATERVEFVEADLMRPLPVERPVDAVVSTATFHWVPDHDALFRNLAAVMRPGASLVAQCGGRGNIATVVDAARRAGSAAFDPTTFAGAEETAARLEAAGFVEIRCWLHDEPTRFPDERAFEDFLRTVCLRPFLEDLPPGEHDGFVHRVAGLMPGREIDYVRLNVTARRGDRRGDRRGG